MKLIAILWLSTALAGMVHVSYGAMKRYDALIHLHSNYSNGTYSIEQLATIINDRS